MSDPLVSIVIPCFNHGKYLMECIDSVLAQTYSNLEIIIVNDGSTDKYTLDLLNSIERQNTRIVHKVNGGLSSARNAGIENSSGAIILPLDADDKIGKTYIEKAVQLLRADENLGVVFCQGEFFGSMTGNMHKKYESFQMELLYNALFCSGVFRKEDCIQVGMYNINMNKGYEDWDFWLRLLKYKPGVYQIPDVLFYYRKTTNSMWDGLSKDKSARTEMENTLFRNNLDIYFDRYGSIIEVLREYENLKKNTDTLESVTKRVQNTMSYKIGNFLLYPLKLLRGKKPRFLF